MSKVVALVHTTPLAMGPANAACQEIYPEAQIKNIVDDSLLADLQDNDGVISHELRKRLAILVKYGAATGADAILLTCSSYSPCAQDFHQDVTVPFFRADDALLAEAVDNGPKIGLIATVPSAIETATEGLKTIAKEQGKQITIAGSLCTEAFEALSKGDSEGHDNLLVTAILQLAPEVDVIVMAQYSMARVMSVLPDDVPVRVLSSPHLGIAHLKQILTASPTS